MKKDFVLETAVVRFHTPLGSRKEPVLLRIGERLALLQSLLQTKVSDLRFFLEYAVGRAVGQGEAGSYHQQQP